MLKADREKAIRYLCGEWMRDAVLTSTELEHPSFSTFRTWLSTNGYSSYLGVHSMTGADNDAELWFDQEFRQVWRR